MEIIGDTVIWTRLGSILRDFANEQESKTLTEDEIALLKDDENAMAVWKRYKEQFEVSQGVINSSLQAGTGIEANLFDVAASAPSAQHTDLSANRNSPRCHHDAVVAAAILAVSRGLINEADLMNPDKNEFGESLFWTNSKYRTRKEDGAVTTALSNLWDSTQGDTKTTRLVGDLCRVYGPSTALPQSVSELLSGEYGSELIAAYGETLTAEFKKMNTLASEPLDNRDHGKGPFGDKKIENRPPPFALTEEDFRVTYQGRSSILAGAKAAVQVALNMGLLSLDGADERAGSEAAWEADLRVLRRQTIRECSRVNADPESFRRDVVFWLGTELREEPI